MIIRGILNCKADSITDAYLVVRISYLATIQTRSLRAGSSATPIVYYEIRFTNGEILATRKARGVTASLPGP
jgi:hypothetical protein